MIFYRKNTKKFLVLYKRLKHAYSVRMIHQKYVQIAKK